MFRKKAVQAILVILFINLSMSYAETMDVSLRIRNDRSDEKIINRENLVAIRKFMVKNNLRQGYGNMYSENYAYHTKRFSFYLDPGNLIEKKLDEMGEFEFHSLVIFDPNRTKLNCRIEFQDEFVINVRLFRPTDFLNVSDFREFASEAIREILAEIKKDTPVSMLQPKITTDTRNFMNAIDLAIQAIQKDSLLHGTEYVLMSVQQIPIKNKWVWRVTFKPKQLVSDDPSKGPLALGGEAFVNVDLSTKETTVTYGE